MAYHTALYLFVFLPAALLAYQLFPARHRWKCLLFFSYLFFWLISGKLVVCLMGMTVFTHYIGVWLGWLKTQEPGAARKSRERAVLIFGIVMLLLFLGYLKYYNFFAANANRLLRTAGSSWGFSAKTLVLPIGISFYTLQAIGYMADVYWEKTAPERSLGKMALFLGFFPQLMEGPISSYSQTAGQLWAGRGLKGEDLSQGGVRILWGLMKKLVVADRLHVLVKTVFGSPQDHRGAVIAVAAIAYTIQLYMEFSGCMDIVIGTGRMFGVTLPENFRRPFASRSASEFWRRWHITLGTWLKTYIFYPISVSGPAKKWNRFAGRKWGRYAARLGVSAMALFPVWLCNGLWHGPRWSYIFYGMYYFAVIFTGLAMEPVWDRASAFFHIRREARYWRPVQLLRTWVIIVIGELFFRAISLKMGIRMFFSMFQGFSLSALWDGTLMKLGLDAGDFLAVAGGCLAVGIAGSLRERRGIGAEQLGKLRLPVRWMLYYGLIFAVIIFGAYGPGYQQVDLIYAGF